MRKTNFPNHHFHGLQRAAGPYRRAMKRLLHRSNFGEIRQGQNLHWGDTTQTVAAFKRTEMFNSVGKSYGMFKPPLRTPFPGMHEHCPLRLGLGPRYAR